MSSLEKCLFRTSTIFLIGLFVFLILSHMGRAGHNDYHFEESYILEIPVMPLLASAMETGSLLSQTELDARPGSASDKQ